MAKKKKDTLDLYKVLEVLNDKINSNTISNDLLLKKLNNIDNKLSSLITMVSLDKSKNKKDLDLLIKSLDLKIDEQKTELKDIHTSLDKEINTIHSIHKNMNKVNLESKQELKNLISKESKNLKQKLTEKIDAYEEATKYTYDTLVSNFDDYSTKTDKKITDSVKSLDSKIEEQNINLDIYKTKNQEEIDKLTISADRLGAHIDKKLSELKEWFIGNIDTLNKTHTKELENTTKTFETNLELQSSEIKTYLLEELKKINQLNLDFLSSEFFTSKEENTTFIFNEFKKVSEKNNETLNSRIEEELNIMIREWNKIKVSNLNNLNTKQERLVSEAFKQLRSEINNDLDDIVQRILNAKIL